MDDDLDLEQFDDEATAAWIERLRPMASERRWERFQAVLAQRTRRITVALEDIYQGHNASACLRSCECFGIQDVHIIEDRYPFEPNAQVSLGSQKWLTLHRYRTAPASDGTPPRRACQQSLRARGYRIAAAALREDAVPIHRVPLDRPLALVFGTEEEGLHADTLAAADLAVVIPMVGFTQSFNVSVSVALSLHALATRLRESGHRWQLTEAERNRIALRWLSRSIRSARQILDEALQTGTGSE